MCRATLRTCFVRTVLLLVVVTVALLAVGYLVSARTPGGLARLTNATRRLRRAHRQSGPLFTSAERERIRAYWNKPGRYQVTPLPQTATRVNQTVAGSVWLKAYNAVAPLRADWETWLVRRLMVDKALARGTIPPADPGLAPQSLIDTVGDPPNFYERVRPNKYVVRFVGDDALSGAIVYTDHVPFTNRYPYYRAANGVNWEGKPIRKYNVQERQVLGELFAQAASTPLERHVLLAVSELEGGFEAVNTYDTGFVSVGFVQFTTGRDGDGSFAEVLASEKTDYPTNFEQDFRAFGVDVAGGDGDGEGNSPALVVVDPRTGEERTGSEAVQAVIYDKRLTAVFERAGLVSDAFRIAQLKTARSHYWPTNDLLSVVVHKVYEQGRNDPQRKPLGAYVGVMANAPPAVRTAQANEETRRAADVTYRLWTEDETQTVPASELFRSEAGIATLLDRKVHTGNIRKVSDSVATLMVAKHLNQIRDTARYERALIRLCRHRADFLRDRTLGQPAL